MELTDREISQAVNAALTEDIGREDVTTRALVGPRLVARARIVARESLVVAGLVFAHAVFKALSRRLRIRALVRDGDRVNAGDAVLEVSGPARPILTGERVALNFVQRLSGVATTTAAFVREIAGTHARILDTRKTTPGWRRFEKYAVQCGGGSNHRLGLFDLFLVKDNHLVALRHAPGGAIAAAVKMCRAYQPGLKVEVETDALDQVREAVAAGADFILLDNMPPPLLRRAVKLVNGRAITEASGGVRLENVRKIAETGVDFISVGALTHSARAADLALDLEAT